MREIISDRNKSFGSATVNRQTSWFNIDPHFAYTLSFLVFVLQFLKLSGSFSYTSKLLPSIVKYLAWTVSGVTEFQLKLSICLCQALTLKCLFYGEGLQKVQLCAGFILHFVAVLAAPNVRNATVSHTPPVPEGCSGLSASVMWDEPMFGGKALLWFMVVTGQRGKQS